MSCKKRKNSSHCMRCVFIVYHSTKIVAVKFCLKTASVKVPVTSRVNPLCLKCMYMIGKYANSRDVILSLTNNAIMGGWLWILRVGFRSLIRRYGGVVFHNLFTYKKFRIKNNYEFAWFFFSLLFRQYRMITYYQFLR